VRAARPLSVAERESPKPADAMRRTGVTHEPAQLARSPASPISAKPKSTPSAATARGDAPTRFLWLKRAWLVVRF
jgi:hypothetical protein